MKKLLKVIVYTTVVVIVVYCVSFTILQVSLLEKYFPLATKLHDIIQGCLKVK